MKLLEFIDLLRMIYGKKDLDLSRVQQMGLLAIKIGQVHALRLDFLPVEKCRELAKLYRKNDDIPAEHVLEKLDRSMFDTIDEEPLASASVGQVHTGTIDGKKVAIKIVKQDFKQKFIKDVNSVRRFVKFALFFYPKLKSVFDPIGILEHIEEYTLKEIDLCEEINGQKTLRKIYDQNKDGFDLDALRFPEIYIDISTSDVMVSEFVEGETFDELLEKDELDYEQLLELFHVHGFYLFRIGTFHGDIHPGNIILNNGKMYFVDTGAISTASKRLSGGLLDFFDALSLFDYKECAACLNKMAEKRIDGERYKKFERDFIELYKDFTDSTVGEVSLTMKMMETIRLGVLSGMRFEKGMFPIIKSLMFLDGMVLRCNPDAKLLLDMRRYIDELRD